jgi:hypothetical protein
MLQTLWLLRYAMLTRMQALSAWPPVAALQMLKDKRYLMNLREADVDAFGKTHIDIRRLK